MQVISALILRQVFRARKPDAHKGDHGHVLVVGGSRQYTGAPGLAALAALRTGVDLATVAAPERAADAVAGCASDVITWPLSGDYIGTKHLNELKKLCAHATAAVIGNGMSSYCETEKAKKERVQVVRELLGMLTVPVVLDADGIRAVSGMQALSNVVLTPHAGEFKVLTGIDVETLSTKKRVKTVKEQAARLESIILLKGHVDIISDGKEVALNKTGNPYMTKGGTGDVLAGVVGSFLAQGIDPFIAAQAGAFLTGRAGDRVARVQKHSLLASDVVECL